MGKSILILYITCEKESPAPLRIAKNQLFRTFAGTLFQYTAAPAAAANFYRAQKILHRRRR